MPSCTFPIRGWLKVLNPQAGSTPSLPLSAWSRVPLAGIVIPPIGWLFLVVYIGMFFQLIFNCLLDEYLLFTESSILLLLAAKEFFYDSRMLHIM